jgi:uncharacterized protein YidB (DUF937 family)
MGLLDGLLGGVGGGMFGGGQQQPANPLLAIALALLQQNGGLQGVLARAQQAGYGEHVQSWIGTGRNLPLDAGALSQIFGHGPLGEIAQQLGISRDEAAGQLAQTLPQLVDEMTPQGEIPADHDDLVNRTLAILRQQRGG